MKLPDSLAPDSFEHFAQTADAVAATTKKLEKAAILGEYFAALTDDDLARAARYFAGQQFALSDARTTNVGGSILSAALMSATGISAEQLSASYARWGDGGDAAFEVFSEAKVNNPASLTLAQTESLRARLIALRGNNARTAPSTQTLARAPPLNGN